MKSHAGALGANSTFLRQSDGLSSTANVVRSAIWGVSRMIAFQTTGTKGMTPILLFPDGNGTDSR